MAWDDVVFGILTGGAYNAVKTVTQVGGAAEDAGAAVSIMGTSVAKLVDELDSFIEELKKLMTIERVTPRSDADLWEEEKKRLDALRRREQDLTNQLGTATGMFDVLILSMKLAIVRSAIDAILYQEPGVIPNTLHNIEEILERFNTMEQPRLEEILDSVNDNLESSHDVVEEVKKLFVVRGWQAVPDAQLSVDASSKIKFLQAEKLSASALLTKNRAVVSQLHSALAQVNPSGFTLPTADIAAANLREPVASAALMEHLGKVLAASGPAPIAVATGAAASATAGTPAAASIAAGQPFAAKALAVSMAFDLAVRERATTLAKQPQAVRLATLLNTNAQSAYIANYARFHGLASFQDRQIVTIDRQLFKLKFVPVDKPGVIPQTLEALRQTVTDVDGTVVEGKSMLANVNQGLVGVGALLSKNSLILKVALAVGGVFFLLNLVALFILLIKLILT
jgi:hypothetical protein